MPVKIVKHLMLPLLLLLGIPGSIAPGRTPTLPIVNRVDVECRQGAVYQQRHYSSDEKISWVLNYLRMQKNLGKPEEDPERAAGDMYTVFVSMADGQKWCVGSALTGISAGVVKPGKKSTRIGAAAFIIFYRPCPAIRSSNRKILANPMVKGGNLWYIEKNAREETEMARGKETNLSSDKLLKIIEYMSACRLPVRLKDISDNLGISQPTVVRYLRTMCDQGYAYHDDHTGCYAMSWKICRLSSSLESNLVLRSMAGSLLSEFANTHNIGVLLAVERDSMLTYLDLVGAPHGSVDTMLRIGKDAPMHSTGSGKILLSAMSPNRVRQWLDQMGLVRLTPHTITNREAFLRELEQVREQGYALDNEECEIGHRCVSVPLYDYTGTVAAAISAFDSSERLTDEAIHERILPALQELAKKISFRMGFSQ